MIGKSIFSDISTIILIFTIVAAIFIYKYGDLKTNTPAISSLLIAAMVVCVPFLGCRIALWGWRKIRKTE
ncbi:hypothetical protein G4G27_05265 [Sphingomonas sp. So64.6b]|uniref:hypothetical protein n=1 Tax=Sphingomonas sp. So64.6b TaxID=2997354 RepID=UPI001601F95A|nr:hypothetical protein [Sphingomonas sp. So64.6b]QNA83478.1 hypothetical protein G4G27_05265 [Sphingomonas sp. So64.6b]